MSLQKAFQIYWFYNRSIKLIYYINFHYFIEENVITKSKLKQNTLYKLCLIHFKFYRLLEEEQIIKAKVLQVFYRIGVSQPPKDKKKGQSEEKTLKRISRENIYLKLTISTALLW
jgi:hypothetical protein